MNPSWNVAKKELYIAVRTKRFLIVMAIYFLLFGFIVYSTKSELMDMGSARVGSVGLWDMWAVRGDVYYTPFTLMFLLNMSLLTIIGAVLGVSLGADAINREVEEGTAKVLFGHPIYRDEVINGKFLGFAVLVLSTSFLTFLLTVGLILLLGLPLTMDSFIRGLMGMLVTALYTLVYLSFGLFLSTLFKKPENSLIVGLLLAIFVPIFYNLIAGAIVDKIVGPEPYWDSPAYNAWEESRNAWILRFNLLNPTHHYVQLIVYIFGGDEFTNYYIPLRDALSYGFNNLALLLVMLLLPFAFSYVRFLTRDLN
ncbi:ABC-type transport system involved in multi-copper enzyme maturation, permease component [Thermococcus nautili]|uniref:ABC transporter permease n=1 Tax=Thermococcus nautili TaxID=195522 RepID=UPI0025571D60|nr:ABC transporter permease [Thermococcus nautili]CAI1493331.1 ABC-type transport system involved in multi-copper enzyme maturation, permease component [Thermococcus nautili]